MASIDPASRPVPSQIEDAAGLAGAQTDEAAPVAADAAQISRTPTSGRPAPSLPQPGEVDAVQGVTSANPQAEAVAATFYEAFVGGDFDTMESIYAPSVRFEDPIFEYDDRAGTMGMWRGLLSKADGMKASYEVLGSEGDQVKVLWKADYELAGRPVHNEIESTLTIEDGKIVDQRDSFSWDKWAKQALPLGPFSSSAPVRMAVTALLRMLVG